MKDIQVSAEFKSQATKAITSIVLFIIIYLVLLAASVGLTIACVLIALQLILSAPNFFTIIIGVGLGSFGILIISFLLKFLFKSHKIDRSHLKEVTQEEQPELFQLIEEIVTEVKTEFPKKVYFSADVNASVFYDSSFWSMFFPIRKNLMIGLGLINTITREELKAILSHEFGHFSQESMRVGSYVYYVNQVIFNLLNDNDSYHQSASNWANKSGFIAIFVIIAMKVVEGIQWVLAKMYGVVNKSYSSLSREMEFHADEIAASVTGYQPLADSLLRMQLADYSLNTAFNYYGERIAENKSSTNIFKEQQLIMELSAASSELTYKNQLPHVTFQDINRYNKSKLFIKDQWASHPSTEDRVKHLKDQPKFINGEESGLANSLIQNLDKVQEEFTQLAFSKVEYSGDIQLMSYEDFKTDFEKGYKKNQFSKVFNEYYDDKNPELFDIKSVETLKTDKDFEQLFSDENIELIYDTQSLGNDVETLKMIQEKTLPLKSFDYDGAKYKRKQARKLIKTLEAELTEKKEFLKKNDEDIYRFFLAKETQKNESSRLQSLYEALFNFDQSIESRMEVYTALGKELEFIHYRTDYETIRSKFKSVKALEFKFKKILQDLLNDPKYQEEITPQIRKNMDEYLKEDLQYFGTTMYLDNNLNILFTALQDYVYLLMRGYFLTKKELLDYQETLL